MKTIKCACTGHMLVLDAADWDCAGEENKWATLDVTMWRPVPEQRSRKGRSLFGNLFYLPHYTWKLRELWQAWKGERYAEWVVLNRNEVEELRQYLTDLLDNRIVN